MSNQDRTINLKAAVRSCINKSYIHLIIPFKEFVIALSVSKSRSPYSNILDQSEVANLMSHSFFIEQ